MEELGDLFEKAYRENRINEDEKVFIDFLLLSLPNIQKEADRKGCVIGISEGKLLVGKPSELDFDTILYENGEWKVSPEELFESLLERVANHQREWNIIKKVQMRDAVHGPQWQDAHFLMRLVDRDIKEIIIQKDMLKGARVLLFIFNPFNGVWGRSWMIVGQTKSGKWMAIDEATYKYTHNEFDTPYEAVFSLINGEIAFGQRQLALYGTALPNGKEWLPFIIEATGRPFIGALIRGR